MTNLAWPLRTLKLGLKSVFCFVQDQYFAHLNRRHPPIDANSGLNLIGYYRADLGLGEALRYLAHSLQCAHIPFLVRKFSPKLRASQSNTSLLAYEAAFCSHPINCLVINPDLLRRLPQWFKHAEWAQRYNIAYWFWELERFPKAWEYALPVINEIWVNTEFNANTMRTVHPRVTKIPFAIEFASPSPRLNRAYFGLPQNTTLFLNSFDFHSSVERKNPQATIAAFLQAFPNRDTPVTLLIKSTNGLAHQEKFNALKKLAQQDARILFLDRQLGEEEKHALLKVADCYVSLHRSEGLGLGLAESMYLGKAVIGTNYSGNVEFMNSHNSALIDYTLVPVEPGQYPHATGQVWAQANIEHAVAMMQKMVRDPSWRNALGAQAALDMRTNHSFAVMGQAIARRLTQIQEMKAAQ